MDAGTLNGAVIKILLTPYSACENRKNRVPFLELFLITESVQYGHADTAEGY